MPFFSKTKKGASGKGLAKRRAGSLSSLTSQDDQKTDDNIAIKLQLDENELIFDSNAGQWYSESNVGGGNAANLRKQNITLQEQNNALKLKNDILMDMVVALKADLAARDKELHVTNN
ncbi:hypothetical protein ACHWQZ_G014006 [Mnemiopsis leidyi]|uniref:Chibby n=1 Tax=Mnemiopsis leidyi TaxID=27923 RepID=E3UKD4_MNELE|nr:chibby [Mnemiopsis leidyi]